MGGRPEASGFDVCLVFGRLRSRRRKLASVYSLAPEKLRTLFAFYALTEEYLPDEINREDVVFLLWAINSPVGDDFDGVENPMDADLLELRIRFTTVWMLRSNWLLSAIIWQRTG